MAPDAQPSKPATLHPQQALLHHQIVLQSATSAPGTHAHSTQLPPCSYPDLLEDLELLADVDKTGGSSLSPASCTNSGLQDLFDLIEDFPEPSELAVNHQRDLEGEPQRVAVQCAFH